MSWTATQRVSLQAIPTPAAREQFASALGLFARVALLVQRHQDGPAKLHISLSEFQCNFSVFKTLKIWVDLLQAEPSSFCLFSGLASIRNKTGNVRPPAPPHSCHMNVEVGFGTWRCFGGGLQTPYKFNQGLTVWLTLTYSPKHHQKLQPWALPPMAWTSCLHAFVVAPWSTPSPVSSSQ